MDRLHLKNSSLSSFGLPGEGVATYRFTTPEQAIEKIKAAHQKGLPVIPSGLGTNCAFLQSKISVIFLKSTNKEILTKKIGDIALITAGAGLIWDDLVRLSVRKRWGGIERLSGIPGTCGAAPVQNIGAYGASLEDTLKFVEAIDLKTLQIVKLSRKDCSFGYRTSIFNTEGRGRFLILSITLELQTREKISRPGHSELSINLSEHPSLFAIRKKVLALRRRKLPNWKQFPNCGSFLKNPVITKKAARILLGENPDAPYWLDQKNKTKFSAAWLIERSGLQKKRWGKIALSSRHSLVLINHGETKHENLQKAIIHIVTTVERKFGIELQPEPNLLNSRFAYEVLKIQMKK